jgi:hypothetical protein
MLSVDECALLSYRVRTAKTSQTILKITTLSMEASIETSVRRQMRSRLEGEGRGEVRFSVNSACCLERIAVSDLAF